MARHSPAHPPFRLTPAHDRLLRGSTTTPVGMYQLHLATADQLCRLHYRAGSLTHVKEQLKALADHGYTLAGTIPTTSSGVPFYYTLGSAGVQYLAALGYEGADTFRAKKEVDKSWLFLKHHLELNDVVISAALIGRADSRMRLSRFATDRTLKRKPIVAVVQGRKVAVVPDAFLHFTVGAARQRFLIEHDRGTEGQAHFRRRIRAYVAYLREERVPVVFTTFVGEARREQMRAWTTRELEGAAARELATAFRFAALTHPPAPDVWCAPVWFTPYDVPPTALLGTETRKDCDDASACL